MASCKCGARQYASIEDARKVERSGADKCPECRTFATDHPWMSGWDPEENRCGDCDIRYGSHGDPWGGRAYRPRNTGGGS